MAIRKQISKGGKRGTDAYLTQTFVAPSKLMSLLLLSLLLLKDVS